MTPTVTGHPTGLVDRLTCHERSPAQYEAMLESTTAMLVDPADGSPLRLNASGVADGEVEAGALVGRNNRYLIRAAIPRFVPAEEQAQTQDSFGYKWARRDAYEYPTYESLIARDEVERWGLASLDDFYAMFPARGTMLEVGCGSAHFASLYVPHLDRSARWIGLDLSGAIDIARARLRPLNGSTDFVQANILEMPFKPATFDQVFARGVLHHTPSTEAAFNACARLVKPGGTFNFLIYRRVGPIREFTDDHIRAYLSRLNPADAWKALESLTRFGRALREARVTINVPENIPYLDIPQGSYDLQQLIYDHFVKAYWNPDLDFDTNQHNTFDWYHPQFAFHHTEDEIRRWCQAAGMEITFIKATWTSWAVRTTRTSAHPESSARNDRT